MGPADVGFVMGLADRDHIGDVTNTRVPGTFDSAEVRRQGPELHMRILLDAGSRKLGGVRHLGDRLGADKRGDFHLGHSGLNETVDDAELFFHGQHLLQILPAVSRTDFNDLNVLHIVPPFFFLCSKRVFSSCGNRIAEKEKLLKT